MLSLIICWSVAILNLNSESSFLAWSLALSLIVQEFLYGGKFLGEIHDLLQVVLSLTLQFEFEGWTFFLYIMQLEVLLLRFI